ncbi:Solute carrier family 30 member 9 [Intoshia linei]|uniref:Proton-coupled zinc antiporter SLC30A9, mitochondrial n=1 Tax=Intoshia linei TaxID=1819745 RepID=A0A177B7A0_9BILA|nr:Solute carrier family 30 member 9 [Intoshia linei]
MKIANVLYARCQTHCIMFKTKINLSNYKLYNRFISGKKIVNVVKVVSGKSKSAKKANIDFSTSYTDNVYITAFRAMDEYLLQYSDLSKLTKIQRRSPYSEENVLNVYLRSDVENGAIKKWGSLKNLENVRLNSQNYKNEKYNDNPVLSTARYIDQQENNSKQTKTIEKSMSLSSFGAGRVVLSAIAINLINTFIKFYAWIISGSHSMFSEFVHSIADTLNQIILAVGIRQSLKMPDSQYPYGFSNIRNIASLISGVSIFLFGSGMSVYHGINGLLNPSHLESLNLAMFILATSFVTEMVSLFFATAELRLNAKKEKIGFFSYIKKNEDPSSSVVFLEDTVSVLGVLIAAGCIQLSSLTNSCIPDALGSVAIGGLLCSVATFVIYKNTNLLVGQSIPSEDVSALTRILEEDRIIRAVHDVKATDMGNKWIRFKAEVDFDGRQVAQRYLKDVDIDTLTKELNEITKYPDKLEPFMLKHGENIIDVLGAEIDRIEKNLKKRNPKLRHVDLEQL